MVSRPTRESRDLAGRNHRRRRALWLQIFSEKAVGPIFFEFIQRKDTLSRGNFEALFKSIERDQLTRGVL